LSEIYERVRERTRLLEKIELYIPGFRGYKEKELRREADRLIREYLLRELNRAYEGFKAIMVALATTGQVGAYELYNQTQAVFDRLIAKLRTMDYGYAGFFDAVKIEEKELDKLLEYDYNLIEEIEKIAKTVSEARSAAFGGDATKLAAALSSLRQELESLYDLLIKREDVITSIGRR